MEIPDRITVRISPKERETIATWLKDHPGTQEEPNTIAGAFKAALEALRQIEGRRRTRQAYETTHTRVRVPKGQPGK